MIPSGLWNRRPASGLATRVPASTSRRSVGSGNIATPAEIVRMRAIQTGHQVDGITGGLEVKEQK